MNGKSVVNADVLQLISQGSVDYIPKRYYVALRLYSISIDLLAFYRECPSLIGYATRYVFNK